jgi:hypothetical protein
MKHYPIAGQDRWEVCYNVYICIPRVASSFPHQCVTCTGKETCPSPSPPPSQSCLNHVCRFGAWADATPTACRGVVFMLHTVCAPLPFLPPHHPHSLSLVHRPGVLRAPSPHKLATMATRLPLSHSVDFRWSGLLVMATIPRCPTPPNPGAPSCCVYE